MQFDAAYTEGISKLTREDIRYAEELGYRIKLLGITKRTPKGIELRVHPTLDPGAAPDRQRRRRDERDPGEGRRGRADDVLRRRRRRGADGERGGRRPGRRDAHAHRRPGASRAAPRVPARPARRRRRSCRWSEVETALLPAHARARPARACSPTSRASSPTATISIDAMVQKEPGEGEEQVDIIMLTHVTVEKERGRRDRGDRGAAGGARARSRASGSRSWAGTDARTCDALRQHPRRHDAAAASPTSCSKGSRRTAGSRCPSAIRAIDRGELAALAAARLPRARVRDPVALHRRHPARRPDGASSTAPTPREVFGTDEITPLRTLEPGLHLLGLSNGPTLAFKDIAMQLLGDLFEHVLARARRDAQHPRRDLRRHRLARPSTRCAASAASRVFMLSPHGRMSPFQTAQMYSLAGPEHPQPRDRRRVRRLPGHREGASSADRRVQGAPSHRRGELDQLGARSLAQVVYYFKATSRRRGRRRARCRSRCRPATSATSAPATSRA